MLWGYFKKVVVADNAAVVANKIFALTDTSFPVVWAGVFAFAVQIYADFSGYTDIARGTARLLGIDLMVNFNHPYLATSPADFSRRWHIRLPWLVTPSTSHWVAAAARPPAPPLTSWQPLPSAASGMASWNYVSLGRLLGRANLPSVTSFGWD